MNNPDLVERLRARRLPGKWSDTVAVDPLCIEAADALEALTINAQSIIKRSDRWQEKAEAAESQLSREAQSRDEVVEECARVAERGVTETIVAPSWLEHAEDGLTLFHEEQIVTRHGGPPQIAAAIRALKSEQNP